MEKISTGASTDSDLRVISIDNKGEIIKPVHKQDPEADDSVPKFRKPGASKQTAKLNTAKPPPQFMLFENYKSDPKFNGSETPLLTED